MGSGVDLAASTKGPLVAGKYYLTNVAAVAQTGVLPEPVRSSELQATCPARPGGNVTYFSGIRQDKQVIVMRLEYGQGQALYRFEKQ